MFFIFAIAFLTGGCNALLSIFEQEEDLVITPSQVSISTNQVFQFTAYKLFEDGRTEDVTAQAAWASSNEDIVRFISPGRIEPVSSGACSISAALGEKSDTNSVHVIYEAPTPSPSPVPDTNPPIPGGGGAISGTVTSSVASLSWALATDDVTPQSCIEYLVYYSTSSLMNTPALAKANGTAFGTYSPLLTETDVFPLSPDTDYYFTVLAKDQNGNEGIYDVLSLTTLSGTPDPTPEPTPNPPSAPDLEAVSDTGMLDDDDITSVYSNLQFTGSADPGASIELFVDGSFAGSATALSGGTWNCTVSNSLSDGMHAVCARTVSGALYSNYSTSIVITVDTAAPGRPSVPDLCALDDDGRADYDDYTSLEDCLTFSGTAENGARIYIDSSISGSAVVDAVGGVWTADLSLQEGAQTINAMAQDTAGNNSPYASLPVKIDKTSPSPGGTIVRDGGTPVSITVSWPFANDNLTSVSELEYAVYYSNTHTLSTLAEIETYGSIGMPFTVNVNSRTITGLAANKDYSINVVVRDRAYRKTAYSCITATTLPVVVPDLSIDVMGVHYSSGSTYDVGDVEVGVDSSPVTFTITNNGEPDLVLAGVPGNWIQISDSMPIDFTVTVQPLTNTIKTGETVTFSIVFRPEAEGEGTAQLRILSNDTDDNPYVVNLTGTGI